jgi:N utilization substance protein A
VNPIIGQVTDLARQTGVDLDEVFEAIEHAVHGSWSRHHDMQDVTRSVNIDRSTGKIEVSFIDGSTQTIDLTHDEHGRVVANAVKNVLAGFVRNAKASDQLERWAGREGTIIRGRVIDSDSKRTMVDVDGATGIIPASKRVNGDFHRTGDTVAFLLTKMGVSRQGQVELVGTRRGTDFVLALVAEHVPEVAGGQVSVVSIARVDGEETLMVVASNAPDVSATWSVRGQDNVRSRSIGQDMPRRERLQIVQHDENPAELVKRALRPDRAKTVTCDDDKCAVIGISGKLDEAQLKRRLTLIGEILDRDMFVEASSDDGSARQRPSETDAGTGQCQYWIRGGAKQCPNRAEPGSRFCSLPGHTDQ